MDYIINEKEALQFFMKNGNGGEKNSIRIIENEFNFKEKIFNNKKEKIFNNKDGAPITWTEVIFDTNPTD